MYDDTFNPLGIQGGGVHPSPPPSNKLRYHSNEQSFLNIFEPKPQILLASANAPMTHFEF